MQLTHCSPCRYSEMLRCLACKRYLPLKRQHTPTLDLHLPRIHETSLLSDCSSNVYRVQHICCWKHTEQLRLRFWLAWALIPQTKPSLTASSSLTRPSLRLTKPKPTLTNGKHHCAISVKHFALNFAPDHLCMQCSSLICFVPELVTLGPRSFGLDKEWPINTTWH